MSIISQRMPFMLEVKEDMFLPDGDVALLELEDKQFLRNNLDYQPI